MMPPNNRSVLEKRKDVRYSSHRASILKQDNVRLYTTIINFSASGVGFLSGQTLNVNEEAELVFEVDIDGKAVHYNIPIIIVRVDADADGFEFNVGANLNKVTFEYRQLLKKLAQMHEQLNKPND